MMNIIDGWLEDVRRVPSPFFNERPTGDSGEVSLLVIHNISLPPNVFGGDDVLDLFLGQLDPSKHPSYESIKHLQVSAHLFIRRDGVIIQFVPFTHRAWHAGMSSFQGQSGCNDYSIGIEMEGCDSLPFTAMQYKQLKDVTLAIQKAYPKISLGKIVGHNDIAPGRKTDPGPLFQWPSFRCSLTEETQ